MVETRTLALRIAAAAAFAVFACACNTAEEEPPPAGGGNGGETTAGGIKLTWQPEGPNLHVTLKAPTTGWVAVGFDPDPNLGMNGANLILGYVAGGVVFVRDDFGISPNSHDADTNLGGRNDVTNPRGEEKGASTEISFTIPLDSGDPYDKALVVGRTYRVLLARGPDGADDLSIKHEVRAAANIIL